MSREKRDVILTDHPLYGIWTNIKTRCFNEKSPRYKDYGGRGVGMAEAWQEDFLVFASDMGPRPPGTSIDRFPNPDGNYEPGNCRWADSIEQNNNRRNNRRLSSNGRTLTLAQWDAELGLSKGTVSVRLGNGMSADKALTRGSLGKTAHLSRADYAESRRRAGEVKAAFRSGMTRTEAAAFVGVSYSVVKKVLARGSHGKAVDF